VDLKEDVSAMKKQLVASGQVPAQHYIYKISFEGKQILEGAPLRDYKITKGVAVHLDVRRNAFNVHIHGPPDLTLEDEESSKQGAAVGAPAPASKKPPAKQAKADAWAKE
jgi:hypothetical protein